MTRRLVAAMVAGVLGWGGGVVVWGDVVTYVVDPARSSLTVSGKYDGITLETQLGRAGSLQTDYAGTITADRDSAGDTLQITGGSVVAQNTGASSRKDDAPANYAFLSLSPGDANVMNWGAMLNFSFSMVSQMITAPESFDAAQIASSITFGDLDYGYYLLSGPRVGRVSSSPMASELAFGHGPAALVTLGGTETLTLPLEFDFAATLPPAGADDGMHSLEIHFSGTLVATPSVPEPQSLAILGIGATILLLSYRWESGGRFRGRSGTAGG